MVKLIKEETDSELFKLNDKERKQKLFGFGMSQLGIRPEWSLQKSYFGKGIVEIYEDGTVYVSKEPYWNPSERNNESNIKICKTIDQLRELDAWAKRRFEPPKEEMIYKMVNRIALKERNGYPDNNFTEEEYFTYIQEAKRDLRNFLNDLDYMAEKEITTNDRGDYNSILTAEDEEDLFRRSALLHNLRNLIELKQYY